MSDVGAVILADNTEKFDYIKLANVTAKRIRRNLNIPVEIITTDSKDNQRLYQKEKVEWRNLSRTSAYSLSPFDRTLVIDADYFVNDDALLPHIHASFDFAIAKDMYDPATGNPYIQQMGKSGIEQLWATVMIFNKSKIAENIFAMADHVLDHYLYYAKLYNFNTFPKRNDYAFTIACHLMGGYGQTDFSLKNFRLINCDFNTNVENINENDILISYNRVEGKKHIQRVKSDLHIQNKNRLFELI
jgi:hypothetical protein